LGFGRCSLERPGQGGTQVKAKCKHPDGCAKVALKGGLCKRHFKEEEEDKKCVDKKLRTETTTDGDTFSFIKPW